MERDVKAEDESSMILFRVHRNESLNRKDCTGMNRVVGVTRFRGRGSQRTVKEMNNGRLCAALRGNLRHSDLSGFCTAVLLMHHTVNPSTVTVFFATSRPRRLFHVT
jgi:hypothetical protein